MTDKESISYQIVALGGRKMAGQKPVAKFKAGQVSAAIWENEITAQNGHKVSVLKTTVERRYKDRYGNWKSGGSFSRNEIPLAIYCLEKAFEKMVTTQEDKASNNNGEEEIPI